MDPGESIAQAAVRETKEETGMDIEATCVIGPYTNPNHVIAYDDGEVRQQYSVCFTSHLIGGQLATSSETSEVRFVRLDWLDDLDINPSMRLRIDHWRVQRSQPYIG